MKSWPETIRLFTEKQRKAATNELIRTPEAKPCDTIKLSTQSELTLNNKAK